MGRSPVALHLNMPVPLHYPDDNQPPKCPFFKILNWLNVMKTSFREDIDRAHPHGVFCMPKAHADSKPFLFP